MTETAPIFARLVERAARIAAARAELRRTAAARRWREARLLWPLFTR